MDENNNKKLKRKNFGKYGMEDNYEITSNKYEGFPIFVDYYKHIKVK